MGFGYSSVSLPMDELRYVASNDQIYRVDHVTLDQGPAKGVSGLEVHNPAGVSFFVFCDRCLDIGWADALGLPLAWTSSRGYIATSLFASEDSGWARTFPGGLLATCGLESTGMPSYADDRYFGLHDRIGHTPAENVVWRIVKSDSGERVIVIEGEAVQAELGQVPLRLHRSITASTTRPEIVILDEVQNMGFKPTLHMFRHHINLGYPIIQPGTIVTSEAKLVGMRGESALPKSMDFPLRMEIEDKVREKVYYCSPLRNNSCMTRVISPEGVRVEITQSVSSWPWLILWRDASPGVNVLGIEPSTSRDEGRKQAELNGETICLKPHEIRKYRTSICIKTDAC